MSVFLDDADKLTFIDFLYAKKSDEGCLLYAYCLMDNHVHLVVKEGCNGIAKLMKRIGTSYVKYFLPLGTVLIDNQLILEYNVLG